MAIVAAAVVVANPVASPPADVTIPAVQLSSGNGLPVDMLDRAFLDAIAPAPPESTNPIDVLKQLLAALAADAGHVGREAVAQAFVAGAAAMAQPTLTSAAPSYVAVPDPVTIPVINPTLLLVPNSVPDAVAGIAPAIHSVLANLRDDVSYVGGQVVEAAFAVGAIVAAEPELIVKTLAALATGDIRAALASAVQAVTAPLGPPLIVFNALREVAEKRLAELRDYLDGLLRGPQFESAAATAPAQAVDPAPSSLGRSPALRQPLQNLPSLRHSPVRPRSAGAEPAGELPSGATDLTNGNKSVPRVRVPAPGELRKQVDGAVDQIRKSVDLLGDAVRNVGKQPPRRTGTAQTR